MGTFLQPVGVYTPRGAKISAQNVGGVRYPSSMLTWSNVQKQAGGFLQPADIGARATIAWQKMSAKEQEDALASSSDGQMKLARDSAGWNETLLQYKLAAGEKIAENDPVGHAVYARPRAQDELKELAKRALRREGTAGRSMSKAAQASLNVQRQRSVAATLLGGAAQEAPGKRTVLGSG